MDTVCRIAAEPDVRLDVAARWRGGDSDRLLSRRHSLLADSVSRVVTAAGWAVHPEVSFSIYGERGVIDQLAWHSQTRHLLVVELKTEFVDVNEMPPAARAARAARAGHRAGAAAAARAAGPPLRRRSEAGPPPGATSRALAPGDAG